MSHATDFKGISVLILAGLAAFSTPACREGERRASLPAASGGELYLMRPGETRWASFENPGGEKGRAGLENQGAKGNPAQQLRAGESKVLLDIKGCGVIRRIWMTLLDKSPKMLRGMRLDMYWDRAATPAVSAPIGSFFGHAAGGMTAFESELFSSPEARSFNCFVPMPFRRAARIVVTNETDAVQPYLFYDIDYTLQKSLPAQALYFHAGWRRENPTALGRDFEILPLVRGRGRYLGANVTVAATSNGAATGVEGAVKVYLDGDREHPTLAGTGTEDYIGDGWGAGPYAHRTQGCLVNGPDRLAFYRYHIPDPILFHADCRVTIQQMTGGDKASILAMAKAGIPLRIVGGDFGQGRITGLLDAHPDLRPEDAPEGFLLVSTCYDVSATAYFYLNRPEAAFPPLVSWAERAAGTR